MSSTPLTGSPEAPSVSVIVCAYTLARWADITAAVDALGEQTLVPSEVLLVVDHNEELVEQAVDRFSGSATPAGIAVRVERNSREQGLSGARNTGIELAKGDLVAFLDDDAIPDRCWLAELVAPFADPAVQGTGGRAVPRWPAERPAWFPVEFDWVVGCSYRGLPESTADVRNVIGCSMAFRAEAFAAVGGFVEGVGRIGTIPKGCEETELCIRLRQHSPQARIVYVPDSVVSHRVSDNRVALRYYLSRCWAEGLSKAQIGELIGDADGTSAERSYVSRTLPSGVVRNLARVLRGDVDGVRRAGAIVLGLAVTTAGYARGRLQRLR